MRSDETIFAPATPVGSGAITVVRISGADSAAICDRVVKFSSGSVASSKGYTLKFGRIFDGEELLDEVIVSIFKAPHSYTGEDSVELSCHASQYIFQRLSQLLVDSGAKSAEPGEFTRRAFVNGKMDLSQAEAVADMISASSKAAHKIALTQLKGGISAELTNLRSQLLEITSLMELELDFSEEDVEFADRSKLRNLLVSAISTLNSLTGSFKLGNAIREGVPVAIVGDVNAGKSTLLNALLGDDRAIVSDVKGTTRDTIEETLVIDGIMFRLIDTAGIRDASETIEKLGIQRTVNKLRNADIVIALVDVSSDLDSIRSSLKKIFAEVNTEEQGVITVINKIDLTDSEAREEKDGGNNIVLNINKLVNSLDSKAITLACSGKFGIGLDQLRKTLADLCHERFPATDSSSVLISNLRHYEALRHAGESLSSVLAALASPTLPSVPDSALQTPLQKVYTPTDLLAQDLREALYYLGTITGEISTDEVLKEIFGKFCIGK